MAIHTNAALASAWVLAASVTMVAAEVPSPYVEIRPGKPTKELRCPTSTPCVVEFDSAYWISARGWKEHYVVDFGVPDAPLRVGASTGGEIDARAIEAIQAVFAHHGARVASIGCTVARRLPALVGLGDAVEVTVRPRGGKPLAPSPIAEIDRMWADAYAKVEAGATPRPQFSEAALATMTGAEFSRPSLVHRYAVVTRSTCHDGKCTERIATGASLYILYSPDSAHAYAYDASFVVPDTKLTATESAKHRAALRAVSATLRSLGTDKVSLPRGTMCALGQLPDDGWFQWHRAP